jgi:hypothetical protein
VTGPPRLAGALRAALLGALVLTGCGAGWTVADIGSLLTKDFGGAWLPESKQELTRLLQVITSAAPLS